MAAGMIPNDSFDTVRMLISFHQVCRLEGAPYYALHGFWPVEVSNGRSGERHAGCDSAMFGLSYLSLRSYHALRS